jgi:hypothetical protein
LIYQGRSGSRLKRITGISVFHARLDWTRQSPWRPPSASSPLRREIVVQVELQTQDKSTVQLEIVLSNSNSGINGNHGYVGEFTVTGGTGPDARPGEGAVSVMVDPSGMSFSFVLKGEMVT